VPNHGFDVIYKDSNKVFYVEMKNKHNTMNSSSAKTTYIKLLGKVLKNKNNYGLLVEVISKHSQNVPWTTTVDSVRVSNERIRRVSIDKFYELVTKQKNAFYCLCKEIPKLLDEVLFVSEELQVEDDVVVEQLKNIDSDLIKSLFSISFGSYIGFGDLPPNEDK
jgi:septation ring formation regulator EzrA